MATTKVTDANKNVSKIVIQAYKDKKLTEKADNFAFTIPINPESLSQKFELTLDANGSIGGEKTSLKVAGTPPNELRLEFYLDNTNTVAGNTLQGVDVTDQVGLLLQAVHKMEGEIHKPYFLKIAWNAAEIFGVQKTTFDCQLKSLDIQYVLFNPKGEPLRAKVSATFVEHVADETRVKAEGKKSPDLTHVHTISPTDRLWLMAHKNYGIPIPLLQVARANNLTTFRNVAPGTEIVLPPYDRTES